MIATPGGEALPHFVVIAQADIPGLTVGSTDRWFVPVCFEVHCLWRGRAWTNSERAEDEARKRHPDRIHASESSPPGETQEKAHGIPT